MEFHTVWFLISIFSTLVLYMFFSTALISFGNITKSGVGEKFKKDKNNSAVLRLRNLIEKKGIVINSIQVWNSFLLLFLGAQIFVYINASPLNIAANIIFVIILFLLLSFVTVILSRVASINAYAAALALSRTFEIVSTITAPFINLFLAVFNPFFKLFGINIKKEVSHYSEEELKLLVRESEHHGAIEKEDRELIHSIFEFGDTIVKEVMTPRMDITCIESNATVNDYIKIAREQGFSRVPVFEESIDNIIGIVSVKDILCAVEQNNLDMGIKEIIKPAYFVPGSKKINELLKEMQNNKVSIAIVVDEYGGTEGLIALEDIVEEIVGEITDEYDDSVTDFQAQEDGSCVVNAKVVIEDVNSRLKLNISTKEFETLGGFAYGLFDKIPREGESVQLKDFTLTIEKTIGQKIKKIRIKKAVTG